MDEKTNEKKHEIIQLFLLIYACVMFSLSVLIPVFYDDMNESAKFGMYFLQDTSFAWVSGAFIYYFGKSFAEVLKKKSFFSNDNQGKQGE